MQEFRSSILKQTANSALAQPGSEAFDTPRSVGEKVSSKGACFKAAQAVPKKVETCPISPSSAANAGSRAGLQREKSMKSQTCPMPTASTSSGKLEAQGNSSYSADGSASVDFVEFSYFGLPGNDPQDRSALTEHADNALVHADVQRERGGASRIGLPLAMIPSQSLRESPSNTLVISPVDSGRWDSPEVGLEWASTSKKVQLPEQVPQEGSSRSSSASHAVRRLRQGGSAALQEEVLWFEARQAERSPQLPAPASQGRHHSNSLNSMGSAVFLEGLSPQFAGPSSPRPTDTRAANSLVSGTAPELLGDRAEASRTLRDIQRLEANDVKAVGRRASFTLNSLASSDAMDLQSLYEEEASRAVQKYCTRHQLEAERHSQPGSASLDSLMSPILSSPSSDAIQRLLEERAGGSAALESPAEDSESMPGRRANSKKRACTVMSLPPLDEVDLFSSSGNDTTFAQLLPNSSGSRSTTRAQLLSKSCDSHSSVLSSHPSAGQNNLDPGSLLSFESSDSLEDRLREGHASLGQSRQLQAGSVIKPPAKWPSRPVDPESLKSFESEVCDLLNSELPLQSSNSLHFGSKAAVPLYSA